MRKLLWVTMLAVGLCSPLQAQERTLFNWCRPAEPQVIIREAPTRIIQQPANNVDLGRLETLGLVSYQELRQQSDSLVRIEGQLQRAADQALISNLAMIQVLAKQWQAQSPWQPVTGIPPASATQPQPIPSASQTNPQPIPSANQTSPQPIPGAGSTQPQGIPGAADTQPTMQVPASLGGYKRPWSGVQ